MMPPKTLASVGMALLMAAILLPCSYLYWVNTRTFEPVDKAVVLEARSAKTESFALNLHGDYYVYIEVDYESWYVDRCDFKSWKDMDWKVYRLNRTGTNERELWASSSEMLKEGEIPAGFKGKPGRYELEWSVADARPCLNKHHPRLRIYTTSDGYQVVAGFLLVFGMFGGGTGFVLILRAGAAFVWNLRREAAVPRMFPGMALHNVIPWKKHREMHPFKDPPNFGLVLGSIFYVLIQIYAIVLTPLESHGLPIDFRERPIVGIEKSPWGETVSVYVDARKGFLLNGRQVKREALEAELKKALDKQMVWVVYLEADSDSVFLDVVYAMDTIRGVQAKLIWITPRTRETWSKK